MKAILFLVALVLGLIFVDTASAQCAGERVAYSCQTTRVEYANLGCAEGAVFGRGFFGRLLGVERRQARREFRRTARVGYLGGC